MKPKKALTLISVMAHQMAEVLSRLDLSDVEGSADLIDLHDDLQSLSLDWSEKRYRKIKRRVESFTPSKTTFTGVNTPEPREPNRLVQHLYENSTDAIKDSVNPTGILPIDATEAEFQELAELLGQTSEGAVLSMDMRENAKVMGQFIEPEAKLDIPSAAASIAKSDQIMESKTREGKCVEVEVSGLSDEAQIAIGIEVTSFLDALGVPARLELDTEEHPEELIKSHDERMKRIKDQGFVAKVRVIPAPDVDRN